MEWTGDDYFELDVATDPTEMEGRLRALVDRGYSGRISAGYCWEWSKPKADYLFPDVKIGGWERPWNNPKDTRVGSAPAGRSGLRPGWLRPGWLHLHGPGLRVRLQRRDPRPRPGVADRPLGGAARTQPGQPGATRGAGGVRPRDPQHLQGAAHPRDAGHVRVLDRRRDAGAASEPHRVTGHIGRAGAVGSSSNRQRVPGQTPDVTSVSSGRPTCTDDSRRSRRCA